MSMFDEHTPPYARSGLSPEAVRATFERLLDLLQHVVLLSNTLLTSSFFDRGTLLARHSLYQHMEALRNALRALRATGLPHLEAPMHKPILEREFRQLCHQYELPCMIPIHALGSRAAEAMLRTDDEFDRPEDVEAAVQYLRECGLLIWEEL